MAAISYFNSPLSRDGEELGLSCSGATQLLEVNVIVCKMKAVLNQEIMIAEKKTTGKIWPLIAKGKRLEGALDTQKFFMGCELFF